MIDNSDKVGNWFVSIVAHKNEVAGFECPTLEDAKLEIERIVSNRSRKGLPTNIATAKQLIEKRKRKYTLDTGFVFGNKIVLYESRS